MDKHDKLIGLHPNNGIFNEWTTSENLLSAPEKIHRKLVENKLKRNESIEEIASWIIKYHINKEKIERIERKKIILDKHKLTKYLFEELKPFPMKDNTKKGNCGEIILSEYLQDCSSYKCLVYRFSYNTNVDEAMKGDDVLLFNLDNLKEKIILGESKFRTTPNKSVVDEASKGFKDKITLPLSMGFIIDRLESAGENEFVEKLEELNREMIIGNVPIVNVGFIISNKNTYINVENHMKSNNPNFMIISFNTDSPEEIVEESFKKAQEMISEV